MSREANRTLNVDHPDHPKNVAAKEALQANTSTPNAPATTESTETQPAADQGSEPAATKPSAPQGSTPDSETVKAGSHAGTKVEKSPEPKGPKVMSKDELFSECLSFTNDFANAGNLTGRAMLAFIERAQGIMNEFKKAKEAQGGKKKK